MNTECRTDVFVSVLNRVHSGGANATTITTTTVATLHSTAQHTIQATRMQAASNRSDECHHPTCAWDKQGRREHGIRSMHLAGPYRCAFLLRALGTIRGVDDVDESSCPHPTKPSFHPTLLRYGGCAAE